MTVEALKECSKKDLAQMAKIQGIPGWHAMRKEELIHALAGDGHGLSLHGNLGDAGGNVGEFGEAKTVQGGDALRPSLSAPDSVPVLSSDPAAATTTTTTTATPASENGLAASADADPHPVWVLSDVIATAPAPRPAAKAKAKATTAGTNTNANIDPSIQILGESSVPSEGSATADVGELAGVSVEPLTSESHLTDGRQPLPPHDGTVGHALPESNGKPPRVRESTPKRTEVSAKTPKTSSPATLTEEVPPPMPSPTPLLTPTDPMLDPATATPTPTATETPTEPIAEPVSVPNACSNPLPTEASVPPGNECDNAHADTGADAAVAPQAPDFQTHDTPTVVDLTLADSVASENTNLNGNATAVAAAPVVKKRPSRSSGKSRAKSASVDVNVNVNGVHGHGDVDGRNDADGATPLVHLNIQFPTPAADMFAPSVNVNVNVASPVADDAAVLPYPEIVSHSSIDNDNGNGTPEPSRHLLPASIANPTPVIPTCAALLESEALLNTPAPAPLITAVSETNPAPSYASASPLIPEPTSTPSALATALLPPVTPPATPQPQPHAARSHNAPKNGHGHSHGHGHGHGHGQGNGHGHSGNGFAHITNPGKAPVASSPTPKPTPDRLEPTPRHLDHRAPRDRVITMVRDPYWLHTYWELSRATLERAKAAMGQDWHTARPILRLMDVTSEDTTSASERHIRDIDIHGEVNNWYIDVGMPPRSFRVDIGYLSRRGKFYVLSRSNVAATPRARVTDSTQTGPAGQRIVEPITVTEDSEGLLNHDLCDLIEQRLQRPMNALSFPTVSPTPFGSYGRDFRFQIDAELVVYGTTEPNARVTLQGEPVKLRPDGTFSVRFTLPDSRQIIPAVAASPDGVEERTIVLAVERNTKQLEPLVHDSNDL